MPNQADSISSPFFVEPKLYVTDFHYSVSEEDLKVPFKDVELISVEIRNTTPISAVLNFATIDHAEKAFAIYNNSKLETYHNKTYLKLLINDPANASHVNEPSSNAYILQVKQLDIKSTTNFTLYDEFRKFGPLFSCRLQYQDNKFRGYALVQFFKQSDAEKAAETMHYTMLGGRNIQVQFHTKSNNNNNNVPKIRTNVTNHGNNNPPGSGHIYSPQGSSNNNNNSYNHNQAAPASPSPEAPLVDPCNLFIKNLDANISSSDLFNHFRKFGRIISARVMRDQETGNSKGFGFVSYTTAEEADKAKSSMHGKTLGTKQIVVRLHEPKKLREAKLANHFNGSPASPSESRAPSRRNSDFYNINTINEFGQEDLSGLAPKARREVLMSELQKRFKSIPSVPSEEVNPIIDHLLNLKVTDVLLILKDAPLLQQKIAEARAFLHERKRRGVNEGTSLNLAPTSINSNISSSNGNNNNNVVMNNNNVTQIPQREKFLNVIKNVCPRNSAEILDLLMTLSAKERTLCYFNAEYLHNRIVEANSALEAVLNDDTGTTFSTPKPLISADITPVSTPPTYKSMEPMVPHSVRSPNISEIPASISNGIHTPEYKEIEDFMDNLRNKPIHEQKQKLGDRLFPKVKSIGLKSATASKVTINLLDTDNLRELAHSMNDPEKFREKVAAAAKKVVSSK